MKCAVVIAHPDDETMFAGGTIAKFASWQWSVICATRGSSVARGEELESACRVLGAKSTILDVRYYGKHGGMAIDREEFLQKMEAKVDLNSFDLVLTHNTDGEFGQRDHLVINQAVTNIVTRPLWTFGFNSECVDLSIHIDTMSRKKKEAAAACYPSQRDRIALIDFSAPETFCVRWS